MKKFFENKPRAWFIVGTIIVGLLTISALVAGYFYSNTNKDDEVLAIVGSEKITMNDVDERIINGLGLDPDSVSEDRIAEVLDSITEQRIIFQKASELGINVNSQEIINFAKQSNGIFENPENTEEPRRSKIEDAIRFQILKEAVMDRVLSRFEADYIKIRFDRHFPDVNDGSDEDRKKDKEYATKLRDEIYNKLLKNEITFENAQQIVNQDKKIDISTYKGTYGNQYGRITGREWYTYFLLKSDAEKALTMNVGMPDASITGVVPINGDEGELTEAYYYVIKPLLVKKGEALTYADWLKEERERKTSRKTSFIQKTKAEAYYFTAVHAIYYDALGNNYNINGITFDLRSRDANSSDPSATTPALCSNGKGAYWARWSRTTSAALTRTRYRISNTNPCTTASVNDTSGGKSWAGCQANDFVFSYSWHSNAPADLKNGNLYGASYNSTTGVNISGVSSPSNGDITPGSTSISVSNDSNGVIHFYWRANRPPVPLRVSATSGTDTDGNYTIEPGKTTAPITLKGKFTDADSDNGSIQIMYKKTTGSNWTSFGINHNAEGPDGLRTARANDVSTGVSDWGWKTPNVAQNSIITFPNVNLTAGSYVWAVRAVDGHSRYSSAWSSQGTFTISAPPPVSNKCEDQNAQNYGGDLPCTYPNTTSCSCSANPKTGLAPLTVEVKCSGTNLSNNRFSYIMGDGTLLPNRGATIYHTYQAGRASSYIITATHEHLTNGTISCTVANGTINVANPGSGDGGEVAP